jgi:hypothetical protein
LDTSYVADNDHYPKTLREALTQAMDREDKIKIAKKHQKKDDKHKPSGDKYGIPPGDTSFVQAKNTSKTKGRKANMLCQVCGGKGHSTLVCPNLDNTDTTEVLDDDGDSASQFFAGGWKDASDPSIYCNFD